MFTGQRFLLRRKKKGKTQRQSFSYRFDTNVILWLRFQLAFLFFPFSTKSSREREKKRKRWRVSTFSRCRITIGNALQGGVKKHRSAKKHYKGNNVVSSGCSTYSFHVRFFSFFASTISMEFFSKSWESESLFSKLDGK